MAENPALIYLKKYVEKKQKLLDDYISSKLPEFENLGEVNKDMVIRFLDFTKQGKGIRGALTVLGYEIAEGTEVNEIINTSISLEIFHAAILIQDDMQDKAEKRRGLQSFHKQFENYGRDKNFKVDYSHYGIAIAMDMVAIGYFMSYDIINSSAFSSELKIKTGKLLSQYAIRLAAGQNLDVSIKPLEYVEEREIINILQLKSAEYTCVLPLLIGATLAGMNNPLKFRAIEEYAYCLGWAFQILDDIIGMFGDEKVTGKPVTSDLREGKNTLLMLHLSKHGTPEQKEFQQKVFGNPDTTIADHEKMKQILKDSGSYQYVMDSGWKYVDEGKKIIPKITENKTHQEILQSLLSYMMERIN